MSAEDTHALRCRLEEAIGRAERAERALQGLLDGLVIDGGDPDVVPDPGLEDRLLASPDLAELFGVRPTFGTLDLCQRIVAGRAALSEGEKP